MIEVLAVFQSFSHCVLSADVLSFGEVFFFAAMHFV